MPRLRSRSVLIVFCLFLAGRESVAQTPLPLDPLTEGERQLADTLARTNSRTLELLTTGRTRHITTRFISVKPPDRTALRDDVPPRRHAEVLFYNYDRDQGVAVLVDLEARRVVDVALIPGQSVPINNEEVQAAASLALADQRVMRMFGGRIPQFSIARRPATREDTGSPRIEGLRTIGATPSDPCYRNRCIVLFFRVDNRYVEMNRVVVDLTAQRVFVREGER